MRVEMLWNVCGVITMVVLTCLLLEIVLFLTLALLIANPKPLIVMPAMPFLVVGGAPVAIDVLM